MYRVSLFFLGLLVAQSACAFVLLNPPNVQGYDNNDITINYNFSSCTQPEAEMLTMLDQALERWSHIPGSRLRQLKIGSPVATTGAQAINASGSSIDYIWPPVVICDDDFENTYGSANSTNAFGIGSARAEGQKYLQGGFVILNYDADTPAGAAVRSSSADGLLSLTTHELGHLLGLGHSNNDAVMKAGGGGNLTGDDYDGIRYLYPREDLIDGDPFACGQISTPSPPTSGLFYILLFLLPLFVYRWMHIKTRRLARLL